MQNIFQFNTLKIKGFFHFGTIIEVCESFKIV